MLWTEIKIDRLYFLFEPHRIIEIRNDTNARFEFKNFKSPPLTWHTDMITNQRLAVFSTNSISELAIVDEKCEADDEKFHEWPINLGFRIRNEPRQIQFDTHLFETSRTVMKMIRLFFTVTSFHGDENFRRNKNELVTKPGKLPLSHQKRCQRWKSSKEQISIRQHTAKSCWTLFRRRIWEIEEFLIWFFST